ncbi:transmembrane-type terpene cyclase [Arthrobacter sp. 35W]|uniref:transmembrane-type terpene cyclase n=1 Tax=Arthrobacter sp. 35W TaxID=1132441 RepID=UPI0003FDFD48|nr:hypothetical protein [Arthrobacter sp. 35W]
MQLFLTALSGLAWTIVYIEAIRLGFRQRTYAIPAAALGLNFAWEWIYSIHDLASANPGLQGYINLIWALADVVVIFTFLRFGRAELPRFIPAWLFALWGIGLVGASFAVQWLFLAEFGPAASAKYSAFLQNLLMSGLFIAMFVARQGPRGQSLLIAVAKWLGTLAPTLLFGVYADSPFILGIGLLCSLFDLAYIALLLWARARPAAFGSAPDPSLAVR